MAGGGPIEARWNVALEIRVLGRVDALVDGHPLPLGGSKQRAVLAILALRANHTVSADELIDGLWGERPPASAAKNVQLYVSRLRRVLREGDSEAEIVTRGRGYLLELSPEALDAARFERLVEQASREAEHGDGNGTAHAALALWGGAPLADVSEEPFAAAEVRRLEELHLRAIELAIDAELAAGRHAEVIGWLEALIAAHPWQERFHAQAMLALYRAGRQTEALELFRHAREVLVEEIGAEPGAELRGLHEAILQQDQALEAPPAKEEPPPQLEGGSPILAGRGQELRRLRELWEEASGGCTVLALVAGSAGIGKTRLAAEFATEVHKAGAAVVYADGGGASDTALQALTRARLSTRPTLLSTRPTLLVLDDADDASSSVLDAAVRLAAEEDEARSLLILVLHHTEHGPPAFAALLESGSVRRLRLGPLNPEASAEIAELYAPGKNVAMPLETLMAESNGVPLEVHLAASRWAQARATERLEASASKTEVERSDLRMAEAELVGNVGELQTARERTDRYVVSEPTELSVPDVCPFRGLAPFDTAHADYFFGRERLVAGLVASVVGSSLLSVVGPSGSGKSSVVRAGLLPALSRGVLPGSERWCQVLMRPGRHPIEGLRRALARTAASRNGESGYDPFAAVLDTLAPGERLVLAVDQFEEIFTACRDEGERAEFAEALVAATGNLDQGVLVVLAIRADFYGRCAEYPALSQKISDNHALVSQMSREELRRAIELPARKAGLRVEPPLVPALLDDVADEPGGLPLLSTTLLELWEERSGRALRYASYEASGGVSGAVARLAERAYRRLTEGQRERARAILLRLADAEEAALVRRRVSLAELDIDADEHAAGALAVLIESRLVTVDEGAVEVAHEALLREWPRLRAWLEEDAEGRRLHQHLTHAATEWQASDRDPSELYRGARLASALDWAGSHDPELNELEREFLDEGRAATERETERQRRTNRRLTALLAGVGVLLAAAVVAGVIAISERQGAREAATAEAAQRLGAQALTEDRLDQALRLASAGVALDDSVATRSNLLSTLLRRPAALGVFNGDGDAIRTLALSPDGRTLALGDVGGTVLLYDTETRELLGQHEASGYVSSLDFDPRGDSLALSAGGDTQGSRIALEILDAENARVRNSASLVRHPPGAIFHWVTYAPGGRSLIVAHNGGDITPSAPTFLRRYDARSVKPLGRTIRVAPRSNSFTPVISAPDGGLLVVTDMATYAVDPQTLRVARRYLVGGETAALSPDGGTLALKGFGRKLRLLDLDSGRVRRLPGGQDSASGIAFSPDGRVLAIANVDGSVLLRSARTGHEIETLAGHGGETWRQVFSPDGRTLYTASEDGSAIIWDVAGNHRLGTPFASGFEWSAKLVGAEGFPPAFAISPDGQSLAVARLDGWVELVDAKTLHRTGRFEAFPDRPVLAVEYSPDGRQLALGGHGGAVGIWDAGSGERIGSLLRTPRGPRADNPEKGNPHNVQALAFGQSGLLAAAGVGGAVRIWDVGRRELTGRPVRLPPFVLGLAFSPDGSQIAIPFGAILGRARHGIEVRDVQSGKRLARFPTDGEVRSVAFSPDGRLLAGGQVDGATLLWETGDWGRVGSPFLLREAMVFAVAFSPDGDTLATSHDDSTVVLWDVESQEPIGSPLLGIGADWKTDTWVTGRFTPDGRRLFAVSDVGRALRWEVDPAVWKRQACLVAGADLAPKQWEEIVPEQDYIDVCRSG